MDAHGAQNPTATVDASEDVASAPNDGLCARRLHEHAGNAAAHETAARARGGPTSPPVENPYLPLKRSVIQPPGWFSLRWGLTVHAAATVVLDTRLGGASWVELSRSSLS